MKQGNYLSSTLWSWEVKERETHINTPSRLGSGLTWAGDLECHQCLLVHGKDPCQADETGTLKSVSCRFYLWYLSNQMKQGKTFTKVQCKRWNKCVTYGGKDKLYARKATPARQIGDNAIGLSWERDVREHRGRALREAATYTVMPQRTGQCRRVESPVMETAISK